MKAKNILKIKERLDDLTTEHEYADQGSATKSVRFDPYEEAFYISYANGTYEFTVSLKEAQKLKQILNRLV